MRSRRPTSGIASAFIFILASLACVAAAHAAAYMTPGFRSKESRPLTLVLLPPQAEFIKAKAVMTNQMVKESEALEVEGAHAIVADLEAKGYKARILTTAELDGTPGLSDLVRRVNDRYQEEWSKIVRKPAKVKEGRYSLGEDVLKICSMLKSDGIAIGRIQAVGSTGGKRFLTALMSAGRAVAQSYARLDLSVVEASGGQVEAYFTGVQPASLKKLLSAPAEIMTKTSKRTLRRYPGATEVKAAARAAAAATAEPSAGQDGDDEDEEETAIEDFEALLGKEPPPEETTPED